MLAYAPDKGHHALVQLRPPAAPGPSGRPRSLCYRRSSGCARFRLSVARPARTGGPGLRGRCRAAPSPFVSRSWSSTPGVGPACRLVDLRRVHRDRLLNLLEQVFVVHDVPEVLVVAVEPIRPADSLEQRTRPAALPHGPVMKLMSVTNSAADRSVILSYAPPPDTLARKPVLAGRPGQHVHRPRRRTPSPRSASPPGPPPTPVVVSAVTRC